MEGKKQTLFGVPIDNVDMKEAVSLATGFLEEEKNHIIVTPNAEIMHMCITDKEVYDIITKADMIVPDGIGVILAAKIMKRPLKEKVAGVDLAANLLGEMEKKGLKLFLLGAKPGIADKAAEKMKESHPSLLIAGTQDGYFKEDAPVISRINESGADVLFVCLGAPKQEKWMLAHKNDLHTKLMLGLGGVLDVYAGVVSRAPDFFVKFGLEWFYRLIKQPSRIGRMMKLPAFIVRAVHARITRKG